MNALSVGFDPSPLLPFVTYPSLIIAEDDFISKIEFPPRKRVHFFDVQKDSFNPLKDMSYRKAREFWDVLKAVYPEGENTLTKANAEYQILCALLERPRKLDTLIPQTKDTQYAHQMIAKLLLSDILTNVLNRPTNMSFRGTIVAKLDRAALGDFDAFVLGNLLIAQYPGTIVIPDFGFYATPSHTGLIRQNRLIAGVATLESVPVKLRRELLMIDEKMASRCTVEDAHSLAIHKGLRPDLLREDSPYSTFVNEAIS